MFGREGVTKAQIPVSGQLGWQALPAAAAILKSLVRSWLGEVVSGSCFQVAAVMDMVYVRQHWLVKTPPETMMASSVSKATNCRATPDTSNS